MKAADFRACPNCGTRNRTKYEYCVRCGEPLQDVPLGEASPAPGRAAATADEGPGIAWGGLIATLAALAAVVATWVAFREPTVAPPPEAFSIGTLPPSLPPPAPPLPGVPGDEPFRRGLSLMARGDNAGAEPLFAEAVAADPENAKYRHAHALSLWGSNRQQESIAEYADAVRLAPDDTLFRVNYAKALVTVRRNEEAAIELEAVLRQQPSNGDAARELARLLGGSNPARAIELYRIAVAQEPTDMVLSQELATALEKSGDVDGAMAAYADIVRRQPDAHISRGLYAEILFSRGQAEEAIFLFRQGVEAYPSAPLLHRGLASLLERSGRVAEAVQEYREYARLAPNAPDAQKLRERADRLERAAAESPATS